MATKTNSTSSTIIYTLLKSDIAFTLNFPNNPVVRRSQQFITTSTKLTDIENYIKKLVISTSGKPKDPNIIRKFIGYDDSFDLSRAPILTTDFIRNNIVFSRTLVYNHNDMFLQSKDIDDFHNVEIYYILITVMNKDESRSISYFSRKQDKVAFEIFEKNIIGENE